MGMDMGPLSRPFAIRQHRTLPHNSTQSQLFIEKLYSSPPPRWAAYPRPASLASLSP